MKSIFITLFCAAAALAADSYKLDKRIPIPGDYGWDYLAVDSAARRLCVSHDSEVVVVDIDSGSLVGKIPNGRSVHGIAIAPEFGRGFITNGQPGTVTIFDLKTLRTIDEVKIGENPNCVLFDPKTKRIFTADRGSQRVSAIDPQSGNVIGTIENMGGKVEYAGADGAGQQGIESRTWQTWADPDYVPYGQPPAIPVRPPKIVSTTSHGDVNGVHFMIFLSMHSLDPGPQFPARFRMIVEAPKGSTNKYEYDPQLGVFRLDRSLYSPMHFPGDYGFAPGTIADDGETLDILCLSSQPSFPSCSIEVRPVGVLEMLDAGQVDHKILAVPARDPRFTAITQLEDVFPHVRREVMAALCRWLRRNE